MKIGAIRISTVLLALWLLTVNAYALSPARPRPLPPLPELDYTEGEINMIANVVNGEVGGICGTVTICYANGETVEADACLLHRIHARVLDNQVWSDLFPDTLRTCISWYWSDSYTATGWRTSEQWQRCREDALAALYGLIEVPDTVLAATCDPHFAERYDGYKLWAKVRWDTGWTSGTFYYYEYGGYTMADILIRGMEMPESCDKCSLFNECWCMVLGIENWRKSYNKPVQGERLPDCPLVPLPERHGRLIDADALQEEFKKFHNGKRLMLIDTAPTIVPSEGD